MTDDKRADNDGETPHAKPDTREKDTREKDGGMPAAGPHARPDLTNPDATPGAGVLPDEGAGDEADGGAG